ncbi:type II toxin-antitoxin system VapC family toxin [Rhizobium sp. DKSPLA3]|uniref:Ribonuclease VapC n=1 Tax=Rhizobium quercicola TaxID=2901226 RepID=A0A9X1NSA0_9HYPH|nr:type II toxin-antitoxin system VapC family toxin [Rhizobium quercicola]MCD7109111.1 type II toxin-antitoxin system VapC family toxin [Rhizobium quercicola]
MSIVIDASIALSWCFEDEASPQTDAIAERVADSGAVVPALFHLEIANVLMLAERRGRISAASLIQRLDLISQLPLETDTIAIARHIREILPLAREHGLAIYDATYLDVAARRGLPLATRDKALSRAAKEMGITVE